jgi:hypothetical protein
MEIKKPLYELENFYFERDSLHYSILFDFCFNGMRKHVSIHIRNPVDEFEWKDELLKEIQEMILDAYDCALSDFIDFVEENYESYFIDREIYNIILKNVFYIEQLFCADRNVLSYNDLGIDFMESL